MAEDTAAAVKDVDTSPRPLGAGFLFALAVAWLAAEMWSAGASLAASTDLTVVVSTLVLSLPAILGGCLLVAATAGLGATQLGRTRIVARGSLGAPGRLLTAGALRSGRPALAHRLVLGTAVGLVTGIVVGATILMIFGSTAAFLVLALTIALTGLLGGAAAALPAPTLAAGLAATLAVFAAAVVLSLFQNPLRALLGAGASPESQISAGGWLAVLAALAQGLVAGLVAYPYLRRRAAGPAWPWYLLAGAMPGLVELVTVLISTIGGSGLTRLASGFSELDAFSLRYVTQGYLTGALIVTFVGGITAMVAIGRTIGRPSG